LINYTFLLVNMQLSEVDIARLKTKIETNSAFDPTRGCRLWKLSASAKGGYPQMKVSNIYCVDGTFIAVKQFRTHRLVCLLWKCGGNLLGGVDLEASHICHEKRCVNPDHLVMESRQENMKRQSCRFLGECVGHDNSVDCQIPPEEVAQFPQYLWCAR
jgi:hypothetical protein